MPMLKKGVKLFIFCCILSLISGCETVKGAFEGAKKDFGAAKEVDTWIQENLW